MNINSYFFEFIKYVLDIVNGYDNIEI